MDLGEPGPARLVERGVAHLLEQLLDHRADPHDLGRLLDEVRRVGGAVAVLGVGRDAHAVLRHDDDALLVGVSLVGGRSCSSGVMPFILPHEPIHRGRGPDRCGDRSVGPAGQRRSAPDRRGRQQRRDQRDADDDGRERQPRDDDGRVHPRSIARSPGPSSASVSG